MPEPTETTGQFSARLNQLFETKLHPSGRAYFDREVAEAVNEAGGDGTISKVYVWQLRTGKAQNPTWKHVVALATFFGVTPDYFFGSSDDTEKPEDPATAAINAALQRPEIRKVVLRASGLSEKALTATMHRLDGARDAEGLPNVDALES